MVWSTIPFLLVELVENQINGRTALFEGGAITANEGWSEIPKGMISQFYGVLNRLGEGHRSVKYTVQLS